MTRLRLTVKINYVVRKIFLYFSVTLKNRARESWGIHLVSHAEVRWSSDRKGRFGGGQDERGERKKRKRKRQEDGK